MAAPADTSISQAASEPADRVNIVKPVEEPFSPPELVVERISPPVLAAALPVPMAPPVPQAVPPSVDIEQDVLAVIAESRTALARGVESIGDELASFARQSIDATAHTAIQLLEIKTWAEAVAVNTSFARSSYDHWLDSAAKVSELGVKLAVESSKPFVSRIEKIWGGARPSC
jgi:hypothetical protein